MSISPTNEPSNEPIIVQQKQSCIDKLWDKVTSAFERAIGWFVDTFKCFFSLDKVRVEMVESSKQKADRYLAKYETAPDEEKPLLAHRVASAAPDLTLTHSEYVANLQKVGLELSDPMKQGLNLADSIESGSPTPYQRAATLFQLLDLNYFLGLKSVHANLIAGDDQDLMNLLGEADDLEALATDLEAHLELFQTYYVAKARNLFNDIQTRDQGIAMLKGEHAGFKRNDEGERVEFNGQAIAEAWEKEINGSDSSDSKSDQ